MAIPSAPQSQSDSLAVRLRERIAQHGPISFRDWMQAALYDESDGYYSGSSGRLRQGRSGDYRTAPETSPLFAATFARYFAQLFSELDSPTDWTIFEVGAGSSDFAHGVLETLQTLYPDVFAATTYVIDETSPDARARAEARLSEFSARVRFKPLSENDMPAGAGIVFSNELIDALPVHRVMMREDKFRELRVGFSQDKFVWIEGDPAPEVQDYHDHAGLHLGEGQIAEINLEAEVFLQRVAGVLARGFVVTVDYGAERDELLMAPHRFQGTLRAFYRHQLMDDPLSRPGEQDLTTTIDWTQMREAGKRVGLESLRHERLDQFLLREGLLEELEMRAGKSSAVDALRLRTGAREMIMPNGLAASFQVLVQKKTPERCV